MIGRTCRVERLHVDAHADDLFAASRDDPSGRTWTYLSVGPWGDAAGFARWLATVHDTRDPLYFAVVDVRTDRAVGIAAYMRVRPSAGSVEVGGIWFSPRLQRTTAATESMYLMMSRAFDDGYRRYEWKCHALNAASRSAAIRLGFTYEGTFRQDDVIKGRSRDTAWYSVLDSEWPQVRTGLQDWLDPANHDEHGRQRRPLRVRADSL